MQSAAEIEGLLARGRARRRLPEPTVRRLLRQRAQLSQREVAAALGVTHPTLSRWEAGRRTPGGLLLERYVELLDRLAAER
jgi:transcriptional regulator with XRE-family HTH domain